ncbi:MAG: hypothetical protein IJB24_04605 [Clostridia bacterium]|nr:hypothetical protein [Clostridia bacterium]
MEIKFKTEEQKLIRVDAKTIAENSQNFLFAEFDFDEGWKGFSKKAVFEQRGKAYSQLLIGDMCAIPSEVICADAFYVSLIGLDGTENVRITSTRVKVGVEKGPSLDAENSSLPTLTEMEQLTAAIESVNGVYTGEAEPENENVRLWVDIERHTAVSGEETTVEGEPVNYAKGLSWVGDSQIWHPTSAALSSTSNTAVRTKGTKESLGSDEVIRATEGEIYRIYGCFGDGVPENASSYNLGVFVRETGAHARGIINSNVLYFPEGELDEDSYFDVQVPSNKEVAAMRLNAFWSSAEAAAEHVKVYKFKSYPDELERELTVIPSQGDKKTLSEAPVLKYRSSNGVFVPAERMAQRFGKLYHRGIYNGKTKLLPYWFYEPYNAEGAALPLIVVLHSSLTKQLLDSERGLGVSENLDYMVHNFTERDMPKFIYKDMFGNIPAYIVMPQTAPDSMGWAERGAEIADLVAQMKKNFNISHVAAMGFSLGGTGAWELAAAYPDLFDRILPIAGGIDGVTNHIKPYCDGARLDLADYMGKDYSSLSADGSYMRSLYTPNEGYREDSELTRSFMNDRIADISGRITGNVKVRAILSADDEQVASSVSQTLCERITDAECVLLSGTSHGGVLEHCLTLRGDILSFLLEG